MAEENTASKSVLQGIGEFTKDVYKILSKTQGNILFSPISVHAILSLASQGAVGKTREALTEVLHVSDMIAAAEGYEDIMSQLNSPADVSVLIANKAYLNEDLLSTAKLNLEFSSIAEEKFLAEIQLLDLKKPEIAAFIINSWVQEKTAYNIGNLISPDALTAYMGLLLLNAVYFKGLWEKPFKPEDIKTEKFFTNDTDTVDVEMMHIKKYFNFKEDKYLNAKFLELPYKNPDFSLIIILPNSKTEIIDLEEKLLEMDLTKISEGMRSEDVIVSLPIFNIEETINFKKILTELGLGVIFDRNDADFSQMLSTSVPLYVSSVVQKVFIEVNEEGTKAAAVTFMGMRLMCGLPPPPQPKVFKADHPFIIVLQSRHKDGAIILFIGRVSEPEY